jgi:hypothetical protein
MLAIILYSLFVAIASGMAVPRDEECRVQEMLHATRLTAGEYIGGKFGAALLTFLLAIGLHVLFMMVFNHLVPNPIADKIRGPFALVNYLRPALVFILPCVVFICGVSFAVGEWTRKPILIFFLPLASVVVCIFFLWDWSPTWLDPAINRILMWVEPTGFRWINETWMKLDRGVDFYNTQAVGYDLPFLLSRVVFIAIGLGAVLASRVHFEATLRGTKAPSGKRWWGFRRPQSAAPAASSEDDASGSRALPLTPIAPMTPMTMAPPGFVRTALLTARYEARNLRSQPGLYLFAPIILLQTIGDTFFRTGAFETPLLLTPGLAAVMSANTLTLLVCLLLLFYTVESVLRETNTGLAPIAYATPASTAATLLGKALANGIVAAVILLAALAGAVIVMLVQGKVALDLLPFILVWGGLLVPTYLLWSSFVTAVLATTGSRYATYALALATLVLTAWMQFRGKMNWVGNWNLWGALTWTDFGSVAPNAGALVWNRLFYLSVMVFLVVWTVRVFPRREHDPTRIVDRLRPRGLVRGGLQLLPFAIVPVALGIGLYVQVQRGFQGRAVEIREKEYWGRNLATWARADTLSLAGVDLDLTLEPQERWFRVEGTYDLVNLTEKPLRNFPMSIGDHFEKIEWTLAGEPFSPENRSRLVVFAPPEPIPPGGTVRVGFSHEGHFPRGFTKNGGGAGQFILEEGVVLTSFSSSFLPVPFYEEDRGVKEDENRLEPPDRPDDFFEGTTKPAFGGGARYPVRTRITGPAEYDYHAVGVKIDETVEEGRRTVTWKTDHPVNFFNVIAGKWKVRRGEGTEIHYLEGHDYNIDEIAETLDASRKYYSEWFYPYPWRDLRLSEFAGIAGYAQGFPTNITFSEGIGFLTRSSAKAKVAFLVTAHEAAHQWWGNILLPGDGPGGNILAEGMAHFSTILLMGQVKGDAARIELCKRLEERYGDRRQIDSEKPLVWIDGTKAGDQTVTYDKGGWVFWMLREQMGPAAAMAGFKDFIGRYATSTDYPVLQDFVRVMREHAPDTEAYDRFTKQWFFSVVVPEYRLSGGGKERTAEGWTARCKVQNAGTGTMEIEIAAVAGEQRYVEQTEEEARQGPPGVAPDWRESRVRIALGPGEEKEVAVPCEFEPARILVDPDARVLQLNRKSATLDL